MNVIKRNSTKVRFDKKKIDTAILKAFKEVNENLRVYSKDIASNISDIIEDEAKRKETEFTVEEIQDRVISLLLKFRQYEVAERYIEYRFKRKLVRETGTVDDTILDLVDGNNEYWKTENSNKNSVLNTTLRDYMAGIVSKDISQRILLPKDVMEAHNEGIIHFHDIDYFLQHMHNCDLVNLEDMLQNGTVISDVLIERPHSFSTACNIATQIIAQVASSQYGGQSISLAHLAPFVDISRKKIHDEVLYERYINGDDDNETKVNRIVEERLKKEITKGIQTIQYQIVTLMTTNGQSPFLTVFMYLNEAKNEQEKKDLALLIQEVLIQRLKGVKNEKGVWISPAFPKLIYVLEEDNIKDNSKYYYLTKLAAKCTSKRLVPDYISEKVMKELKGGNCYPVMGCRSALTVWKNKEGIDTFYGRFNQGVVTLSLPDIALSSNKDINKFWEIFEERTELCHKALKCRHNRLRGTLTDVAPILWQHGAISRLKKGEVIDDLLFNGYSTISLGYAGLYECVKYMTGLSHSDEGEGERFAIEVMQRLNDKCKQWKEEEKIDYSLYGTPLESATYKFAKSLQRRFGLIEGITDRNYITNSYHIPVFEEIDAFEKLRIESKFQRLSPGGAISYIETADMSNNLEAVMSVIKFIYDNIMYAELNTKSDYCHECGWDGEIKLIDENNKLIWECPNCKNKDTSKMNIVRRTCGYLGLGSNGWNQGRLGDINDRYIHLDDIEK